MDTNKNIIALGIDQGIANMGYCILSLNKNNQHEPIILKSGIFKTDNSEPMQNRIKHLYDGLKALVENHPGINIIGTESLFVNGFKSGGRNKSAAIVNTNMITGAIMLLGAKNDILIKQYTPGAVKKYITGVGDATKMSVEESLKAIIDKNKVEIIADHQSDAIAIAWTSAMDCLINGLEQLKTDAATPKPSTRSKRPKIVQTKAFLYEAQNVQKELNCDEHLSFYKNQIDANALNDIKCHSITGRFKKSLIMLNRQDVSCKEMMLGYEVGKKTAKNAILIPEMTWYCAELKKDTSGSYKRSFGHHQRKLATFKEYQAKTGGNILEILDEQDPSNTIWIYIEIEPIK